MATGIQKPNFRLLSIDGGGIRGIIPALILAEIEKRTNRPISELFDAFAGTSTGAIVALGLTKPGAKVGTAAEIAELYRAKGATIFKRRLIDRVLGFPFDFARHFTKDIPRDLDATDLFQPRYASQNRRDVLHGFFQDTRLTAALKPVFIPAYDTRLRCPIFFVSRAAHEADQKYYESVSAISMVDALLATTAAPTYFPPHRVDRPLGGQYSLIDGGVFSNNPTGLAHAFLRGPDYAGDAVLSIGTGSTQHVYEYDKIRGWGLLMWASPLLKIMFDGQAEAVSVALARRLETAHYLRLQELLDQNASDDLDDVSPENIERLEQLANKIIADNSQEIDELCLKLVEPQTVSAIS